MNPSDTALVSIHVSEYSSLRNEINSFHAIEHQTLNFNIAILAALIGFVAKAEVITSYRSLLFLLAPVPFLLLGFFFGYAQMRIIQVAAYLNKQLRPRVVATLGRDDVWGWESFRRSDECPVAIFANALSLLRWFLFLWPALVAGWAFFRPAEIKLSTISITAGEVRITAAIEVCFFLCLLAFGLFCASLLPKKVV
jgi:hypothetical protein